MSDMAETKTEERVDPLFKSRCENWASRASLGMGPATPAQWEELRDLLLEAATRVPAPPKGAN